MDDLRKKIIEAVTPYAFGDDGELTALSDKDCYQWIDAIAALIDSYAEKEVEKAINQGRLEEAEYQLTRRVKGVKRSKYGATIQHGQAYWLQRVKTLKALGGEPEGKPNE